MSEAVVSNERSDVRELCLLGPQKFAARRDIEEEVAYGDDRALRQRRFVTAKDLSARDFYRRTRRFVNGASFE